jgi:hypothetical protein
MFNSSCGNKSSEIFVVLNLVNQFIFILVLTENVSTSTLVAYTKTANTPGVTLLIKNGGTGDGEAQNFCNHKNVCSTQIINCCC